MSYSKTFSEGLLYDIDLQDRYKIQDTRYKTLFKLGMVI